MNKQLLFFILLPLFGASLTVQAQYFRWVDENGNIHYVETLPPNAVTQGYSRLNKHGMEVSTQEGALSEQEIQKKEEKLSSEKEKRLKILEEQRYDGYLLNTYSSEKDVIKLYRNKLNLLGARLRLYKEKLATMNEKKAVTQKKYERAKSDDRKAALQQHINLIDADLQAYHQAIQETQSEQKQLQQRYHKDLLRYRQLQAMPKETDDSKE